MTNTLTIYGPAFSNYVRTVLLCCEEKGINYTLVDRLSPKDLDQLATPFRKVPILQHGDVTLFETSAICRYIDRAFEGPALSPIDAAELGQMEQWISAANGYFDPVFIRQYVLSYAFPKTADGKPDEKAIALTLPAVDKQLSILEQALAEREYFSGGMVGIADYFLIPMLYYVNSVATGQALLADKPNCLAYITKMMTRPSCQGILKPAAISAAA